MTNPIPFTRLPVEANPSYKIKIENYPTADHPNLYHPIMPTGKITTELCKQLICDIVMVNDGAVEAQFDSDFYAGHIAIFPENWKRREKRTDKKTKITVREFDCTPFDDQLRAYVTDDGTKITEVYISGE